MYEPRFTYHGFRYVEVTGFPGKPTLAALEGPAWCTTIWSAAGKFACSNPLLNHIYQNIVGACAAITAASPPIARSATSARAGWATAPPNPRAKPTCSTSRRFYAKWVAGHGRRAEAQRQRAGRLPRLLADLQRQRHLAEQLHHHSRHAARAIWRRAHDRSAIMPA